MDWLALLTAFGVGSIVSAGVQWWLETHRQTQKLRFEERKECYVGVLEAYHRVARENSSESRLNFGYWELRSRLVASTETLKILDEFAETLPASGDRKAAEDKLLISMRNDLGVSGHL